jgi:murein DD-endopeptidase MepM/ murein hydrolase activator NlpD
MQTISTNTITQGEHGTYHAVDIGPSPDPYYYAPEDGTITGVGDSGTCGFRLGMDGATGAHGFCHNSEIYVKVGDKVKRGQKLAKMGYTGYTQPDDVPQGTHVHWVINRNGTYVYPPNYINEPFIKGGATMPTKQEIKHYFNLLVNRDPRPDEYEFYVGKSWTAVVNETTRYYIAVKQKEVDELKKQLDAQGTELAPGKYVVK